MTEGPERCETPLQQSMMFFLRALIVLLLLCISGVAEAEQRTEVSLGVEPIDQSGSCPANVKLSTKIVLPRPGKVQYRFVRSDGILDTLKTLNFEKPGEKEVVASWNFIRDFSGWVQLKIVQPENVESEKIPFQVQCTSGQIGGPGGISTSDFSHDLISMIAGTTVQVSHAGAGQPLYGNPVPVWRRALEIPAPKEQTSDAGEVPARVIQECERKFKNDPKRRETCIGEVRKRFDGHWRVFKPVYQSYISFPDHLKKLNRQLQDKALDIPVYETALPKKVESALSLLSGGIYTTDRVKIFVNNLHALVDLADARLTIRDGMPVLVIKMTSGQPTILCEGHAEWFLGLFEDWADYYCPDMDLTNIKLEIRLIPSVTQEGKLSYSDVKATFLADAITGATGDLADFFAGYKADLKETIESEVRAKFLSDDVRSALAGILNNLLKREFGRDRVRGVYGKGNSLFVVF